MDINRAIFLHQAGRIAEAKAAYAAVLAQTPDDYNAWHRLGIAHLQSREPLDAVTCIKKALVIDPNYIEAYFDLGTVLTMLKRLEEAMTCFEKVLALKPEHAGAHNNLGIVLKALDQHEQAIQHYQKGLALKPDYVEAHNNLGNALQDLNRFEEALPCYQKALTLKPDNAAAHNNLGNVLQVLNKRHDAKQSYARALAVKPDFMHAQIQYLHLCAHEALWQPEQERSLLARVSHHSHRGEITPFPFLHFVESAALQKDIARLHASSFLAANPAPVPVRPIAPNADPRIRIAYFSGDFRAHPVSYLMAELFDLHDGSRFDIILLSYGPNDDSDIRKRIEAAARFVELHGLSLPAMRDRIYAIQPDILIDLQGYTLGSLSKLLAQRVAPLQVNWHGYPGTMSADFIDYIIADPFLVPTGAEEFYSERIVRLPDCYQPNDRTRAVAASRGRAAYGLPETGVVFCSFNQVAKIRPDIFSIWLAVLGEIKDSVLWIMAPEAEQNLRRVASDSGIDPSRLLIAPRLPLMADHLARYRVADIALDTYPYGSHATASDALWAGCPVVALVGETFASRVSGSLLNAVGLAELIAYSREDYKRLILHLAQAESYRNELRARLQKNRDTAPLFDTPRFVRNLERAYETMIARTRAGLPPANITL